MAFDPYLQWLNIPPDRRPPSYFDLLGVSPEETDAARIREHFTRRYEHVRKYTLLAPHAQDATRILNELSTALNCLLDARRRQQYVRQLGGASAAALAGRDAGLAPRGEASAGMDSPPPGEGSDLVGPALRAAAALPPAMPRTAPQEPAAAAISPYLLAGLVGGGALLGAVAILAVVLLTRRDVAISADSAVLPPSESAAGVSPDALADSSGKGEPGDAPGQGGLGAMRQPPSPPTAEAGSATNGQTDSPASLDADASGIAPLGPSSMLPPGAAGQGGDSASPGKEIVRFRRALSSSAFYPPTMTLPGGTAPPGMLVYPSEGVVPSVGPPGSPLAAIPGPEVLAAAPTLAFTREGRLAVEHAGTLQIWDAQQGTVLATHSLGVAGPVRCMALSYDSKTLACSAGKLVVLWDVPKGQLIETLVGYESGVTALAFSPDGTMLALGCPAGESNLEMFAHGERRFYRTREPESRPVTAVDFSPDGSIIASASGGAVRLWEAATGEPLAALAGHAADVESLDFSPDGETLASGDAAGGIRLWNVERRDFRRVLAGHRGAVRSLSYFPSGSVLASAGEDGKLLLWDAAGGALLQTVPMHNPLFDFPSPENDAFGRVSVAFSPDGSLLSLAGSSAVAKVYDVAAAKVPSREGAGAPRSAGDVSAPAGGMPFSPFDAAPGGAAGRAGWSEAAAGRGRRLPVAPAVSLDFHPNGSLVAVAQANSVKLRRIPDGEVVLSLDGHAAAVRHLTFHPGGGLLASASDDRTVKLWDVASGRVRHSLAGFSSSPTCAAFDPEGPTVVTGSNDKILRLWSVATGEARQRFMGSPGYVRCVALSATGSVMASGSEGPNVQLWAVDSMKQRRWLEGHQGGVNCLVFQPNGSLLASASDDRTVRVWGRLKGELIRTLEGHLGEVMSVAFSRDGTLLASGGKDRTVKLWNAASGELIATFLPHPWPVMSVAFSPDGTMLAAGSAHQAGFADPAASLPGYPGLMPDYGVYPAPGSFTGTTLSTETTGSGGLTLWDIQDKTQTGDAGPKGNAAD